MNPHSSFIRVPRHALTLAAALGFVLLGCKTTTTSDDSHPDEAVVRDAPAETDTTTVAIVPDEGCPELEPDLTTVIGAKLDRRGLHVRVRTTTWCNEHEFTVHTCEAAEDTTTYRISETNDCELPNDGVVEHVLFIEREDLGDVGRVERFDAETVTLAR